MRPLASTPVASMQKTPAPDSASELICVKCQSLASPSTEEYWHMGAPMRRLGSFGPRGGMGVNKALMGGYPDREGEILATSVARRSSRLNPPAAQPSQAPRKGRWFEA